jgi:hypothetical protein
MSRSKRLNFFPRIRSFLAEEGPLSGLISDKDYKTHTQAPPPPIPLEPPPPYEASEHAHPSPQPIPEPCLPADHHSPKKEPTQQRQRLAKSRQNVQDAFTRLSMDPASSIKWVEENPEGNVDRWRNFLYHCLAWEYGVRPSPILNRDDQRHFVLLGRLMYAFLSRPKKRGNENVLGEDLSNQVRACLVANFYHPIETILGLDKDQIYLKLLVFLDESGFEPVLRRDDGDDGVRWSLERYATMQRWRELAERIEDDVGLVEVVVTLAEDGEDGKSKRRVLVEAVWKVRVHYAERAAYSI